jgi:electron transport complex protein RnfC
MPYVSRIVTVAGNCIASPKNVSVPLGTSVQELIDYCGGFRKSPACLVLGSPMTGCAVTDTNHIVTKDTVAVLAFSHVPAEAESSVCIRCGRCAEVCPMRLMPFAIVRAAERGNWTRVEKLGGRVCMECGDCSYVCPGGVKLREKMIFAKSGLAALSTAVDETVISEFEEKEEAVREEE